MKYDAVWGEDGLSQQRIICKEWLLGIPTFSMNHQQISTDILLVALAIETAVL